MTGDLLSAERVTKRGLFEPAAVARLVDEHRRGRRDRSMQIWQLLTLELWTEQFLDRTPRRADCRTPLSPTGARGVKLESGL
jgi:hypothetical protein